MSVDEHLRQVRIKPVVSYPHEAQVDQTYLMTIDLQVTSSPDEWPYEEEEYPVWFILDTLPAFSHKPVSEGEPSVVLHRFGGTYGPARFLLTAAKKPMTGEIRILMVNKWGLPIERFVVKSNITRGVITEQKPVRSGIRLADAPEIGEKGQQRNVELERLEPPDMRSIPVLVQALDNQWIPPTLLHQVMQKGQLTESMDKRLRKLVRAEYVRALINGEQLVINRAYIYNNPALYQDYIQNDQNREAFKALLDEGAIVPYLFTEHSPVELPTYVDAGGFRAWREVCEEVRVQCLRLSWDDKENETLTRNQLARRFHTFAVGAAVGDIDAYIRVFGLDESAKEGLRKRLVEMARFCLDIASQGRLATRNDLYKAFVTAGDNPVERKYDSSKPFAAEIKQLLDLAYNSNLPDALGGYLITPVDSLPRTALQEWQQSTRQPTITGEELLALLPRMTFDLVGRGLYLKSMDLLSLQDVWEIRRMDEWAAYIESLEELLKNPLQFADGGAAKVYESYTGLAKQMTRLMQQRYTGRMETAVVPWEPSIELVINVAGAVLAVTLTPEGPVYQFSGDVPPIETAPVVGRLVIRDRVGKRAQADLAISIDFFRYTMKDARKQWEDMQRQVKKLPGFREAKVPLEEEMPTINYQELEY